MHTSDRYNDSPQQARYLALLERRFGIERAAPPRECFRRVRGHDLHIDLHTPRESPRGTVILLHGAGAHGRLLAPFARPCVEQGFEVWAPDLPGYGITLPASAVTRYDEWIEIVVALADEAAARGPVYLFGLSVGGLTALRSAQRARNVTGVIATTLVDPRHAPTFDQLGRAVLLGRVSRWLFAHLPALAEHLRVVLRWVAPVEKLTEDTELAQLLSNDPQIGKSKVSLGFLRSLHHHTEGRPDYDLPCPLLLVHPGADAWTPLSLSRRVFDAVGSPKQLVVLSNGSHAPLEQPAYDQLCAAVAAFVADPTFRFRAAAAGRV
jgi:alpha-beta hydrolase superfamily lysophospholipase